MREKMKKILCLALSFILLGSSIQVFAQNVTAERVVSKEEMGKLTEKLRSVRQMLSKFNQDFSTVLDLEVSGTATTVDLQNYFNRIRYMSSQAKKLDQAYTGLLDKSYSVVSYISAEEGKTALERLTYEYIGTPEVLIKNHHLEEGVLLEKIEGIIDGLQNAWINQTPLEDLIASAQKNETVVNELINALDDRLMELNNVLQKSSAQNEEIFVKNMREIITRHITKEEVLARAMKTIPEEELRAIGWVAEYNYRSASDLQIALAMRRYLKKMGIKNRPSIFRIFKEVACDNWYLKQFDPILSKDYKYRRLIEDFPLLQNGKYVPARYTIRRVLRATPIVVIGAVLTAAAISEIKADNSFSEGTRGARKIKELAEKVKNGDASFMESVVYYSDNRSSSVVNKDAVLLIDAISLSLVLKQAEQDFDLIAQNVEKEMEDEYSELVGEEIENSLNMFYDEALKQAEEGMI